MRHLRLAAALVTLPLVAVGCGTAIGSGSTADPPSGTGVTPTAPASSTPPVTARAFAAQLLAGIAVPAGARGTDRPPSKAFEHPPQWPGLSHTPVVLKRFWYVDAPAAQVLGWLRTHAPSTLRPEASGSTGGSGAGPRSGLSFQAYRVSTLPAGLAIGDLYLSVAPTGPHSSAVGAYALTLAQPPRPASETVPVDLDSALVAWSLAPGGTPARKLLRGPAARRLARDFDALRVDTAGPVPCPMIPAGSDIVVTFRADGHSWRADVPSCPAIRVTRDGVAQPALAFGPAFLADLKRYAGRLPADGPPTGGVIPLVHPPARGPAPTPASPR